MKSLKPLFRNAVAAATLAIAPFGAAFAIPALVAVGPMLSLTSPTGNLHPAGSHFVVDVVGSGLVDLYAYQFSINFDPTFFHVLDVTEGPFLANAGATFFDGGTIDNNAGTVDFTFDTLISAVPGAFGSGVLAEIDLAALTFGTSSISLSDILALNSALNEITVTALPISLAVPEPGTMALIFLGAGLCLALCKRFPRGAKAAHRAVAVP